MLPLKEKNRDAHIDYIKYTQEQADILRGTVESSKTPDSNTLVLPSTGLKSSTSASRSQPTGNKKNDRNSQTPSSNMKNKIEVQVRRANLSSNKRNRVKDPICDANVKHNMLNVNFELICVKCKQCKVFTEIGYKWKPTGKLFTLVGNSCPLTRITSIKVVPLKAITLHLVETQKPELKVYSRKPKQVKSIDVPSSSSLINDRLSRLFSGTVRFRNDQISKIMGYGDYQLGNVTILRGLGHNLFSVGQFYYSDLEVAFRKNTCFIWNLEGVDLLSGSRDTNLYIISLDDMLKTSPICLLSKASKTMSWLWHRRLSHLNFGKSKKSSHQPKAEDTNQEKLYLLHMDLCGPMRVESINGKKSKDEAPDAIIKCIKNIQVRLNATVRNVRTDNGTEFVNQTLREFYENVGISHQTSVARTPQQNGVVERRNQTLVEAARTMLIFSKAPLFLWAEAINTACYTQNRSLIRL
ncbi:retrovirus-related pol polyprotein from transposon TNT 1-94 [Tanacetum coccineum]